MIGLLKKDLYALARMYLKNLLLVFVLYAVMALTTGVTFIVYFTIWLMSFYSLSAFSLDEAAGWYRYAKTLPVSAGQVVTARTLVMVLSTLIGVVFGVIVGVAAHFYRGEPPLEELLYTLPLITGLSLASMGLMLPAAYKWGVEKARNTFLVVFMVVCVGAYLLRKSALTQDVLNTLEAMLNRGPLPCILVLAAGAVILVLGCAVSCAIYRKKEF